jgi:hypothetical protein
MEENTLQRIKKYIDLKRISIRLFEQSVGMSNGSFASQLKNNKTIGVDKLENILYIYQDINPSWLLTGTGEMLKPPAGGGGGASVTARDITGVIGNGTQVVQQGDNNGSVYFGGESGDLEKLKNSQILELYKDVQKRLKAKDEHIKEITKQAFERNEVRFAELKRKEEQVDKLLTENFDLRRQNTELTNRLLSILSPQSANVELHPYTEPDAGYSIAAAPQAEYKKSNH